MQCIDPVRGLLAGMLLLLTACMTTHPPVLPTAIKVAVKTHLVCTRIAHWMKPQDHEQLRILVDTAQAQQSVSWSRGVAHYIASSRAIFLNERAQPCRLYQFTRRSLFSRAMMCLETACRDTKGQWIRVDPVDFN